DFLSQK
ncbi:hypothetical protein D039_4749B, partial [Vibrio parahaemolyticus EKP-028]